MPTRRKQAAMNTPICDFVREYDDRHAVRLHMPGHKGVNVLGAEALDITEIEGADVLYHADGIIRQSEENASGIFGTSRTLYSTEGSSLCIRAMLYLVSMLAKASGKPRAHIAAGRNAHKTFITAAALLGIDVTWMYSSGSEGLTACRLSAEETEQVIIGKHPDAVYITSPDYLGNTADIRGIAEVCHKHGCLLIVDNAHGAYLKFIPQSGSSPDTAEYTMPEQQQTLCRHAAENADASEYDNEYGSDRMMRSMHPIELGADMCCDSAHKTLPVLTGGAYLHIAERAPKLWKESAEHALSMFASTSPSYLIMQSLDMANKIIADGYDELCRKLALRLSMLKRRLIDAGWELCGDEALKLCIASKSFGYLGTELAKLLEDSSIYIEFCDRDYAVMMFTPCTSESDIERLEEALLSIKRREPIAEQPPKLSVGRRMMSIRDALMSEGELTDIDSAAGRVLAEPGVTCPPAVPIAVCGELIDEDAVSCFKYYGINEVKVVRN